MAAIASLSSEPVLSASFRVRCGNTADLFKTLLAGRLFPRRAEPITVITVYDDSNNFGGLKSVNSVELLVTEVLDMSVWKTPRTKWIIRGYVLDDRFNGPRTNPFHPEHAKFELECNTKTDEGILQILAHDQPPPLVEMIEWDEMIVRIQKDLQKPNTALEMETQNWKTSEVRRGLITDAWFGNDRFRIDRNQVTTLIHSTEDQPKWVDRPAGCIWCMIPRNPDAIKPLAFRDGRIHFESFVGDQTDHIRCRETFTIYPKTQGG